MADYPAMPLWIRDYLSDTGHLNAQEHGAYMLLLMAAWMRPNCDLPDDDKKLAAFAAVTPAQWKRIKPTVMEFWTLDGRSRTWKQKRQQQVRMSVADKSRKQADRAAKGWRERKKADAVAEPRQCLNQRQRQREERPSQEKGFEASPSEGRAHGLRVVAGGDGWDW